MARAKAAPPDKAALDRLVADLRVLDVDGITRAAWGWERHERERLEAYRAAERDALAAVEAADLAPAWEEYRRALFGLTEGRGALVYWKAKHGDIGHRAERAAFGAALGIFARNGLPHERYVALVRPMAEALPWLLPETAPAPRARGA